MRLPIAMKKKAFLFPGQGSQYVGMGKVLCEASNTASELFEQASDALHLDLKKLCWEGELSTLTLSQNAQPAILTIGYAMYRVCMQELGLRPDAMAGHSLGEFTALTCAGAIAFEDAVRLVQKRGEFMSLQGTDGAMFAVMTREIDQIKELCYRETDETGSVSISNYNSHVQTVISGHRAKVQRVVDALSNREIKCRELNVSAPFHCALMAPAAQQLREELKRYTFRKPNCPVLSNVTAQPYASAEEIAEKLVLQVTEPVQWVESMKWLRRANVEYCVELGPGHVLQSLMKRNYSEIKVFSYDEAGEAEKLKAYVEASYIPFLSRCMGLAVSARNTCWDNEIYRQGVIAPYNRLRAMQDKVEAEQRKASEAEMLEGARLLKTILTTKGCAEEEQAERFRDLLADTGMEQTLLLPF